VRRVKMNKKRNLVMDNSFTHVKWKEKEHKKNKRAYAVSLTRTFLQNMTRSCLPGACPFFSIKSNSIVMVIERQLLPLF